MPRGGDDSLAAGSEARGWRVRFAPSPTGALHVGSMRTALFNWLAARSTGGRFVLRIEDTDQGRYVEGSEAQILESLRWLGLHWDEGPEVGGPHAPYVQSLRLDLYRAVAEELVARGAAYWCTCSRQRLAAMRQAQRRAGRPTRYDRRCLGRQEEVAAERAAGVAAVLRLRIPEGELAWDDLVRGRIVFAATDVDDQVLLKADGFPTYHLAHVVDDHAMGISHVIRAEEWIPSTPKHLALFAALGWEPPHYAHVPVVLGPDGQKLSKRRGAPDVLEYRDRGYLPEALVNVMALLGWSPGGEEEIFTPAELCARFSVDRINPASATFDPRRLDAFCAEHIRRLDPEDLAARLEPFLPGVDAALRRALAPLLQPRITTLRDAAGLVEPVLRPPVIDATTPWPPPKVDGPVAAALLDAAIAEVEAGGLADVVALRQRLTQLCEQLGVRARDGFRTYYVALYGSPQGLPVFDVMALLGRTETLVRLRRAREYLGVATTTGEQR